MSKLCGIYRFDSRPVSVGDEARVRAALAGAGCFTPQTCRQPGLVLGWVAGANARQGQGLFQTPDRSVCLWDGRIDNRNDLLRQTGLPPECSDAALIWNCYRRKGVDGLRDVVGDWSVCLWDANRRTIILASDYAGIRPLYYHRSVDALYWSSSLADLVCWTGTTELDDTYVAGFLVRGNVPNRTPYAGILPVPPARAVSISQDGILEHTFWTPPIHQETRYPDERQYEERMLELFRESVEVRLATGAPTCSELSGGLDSSSIVCMADRLRAEMPGCGPDLITFSYTHQDSPDEKFYREIERVCHVSACHLDLRECPAVVADRLGTTPSLWEPRFRLLARRMAAMGSSVLLTGQLGDFIMGNIQDDLGQVTEWLAKGRFGKACRAAYAWGRAMQAPIYPILWRAIREAWFSWVPSTSPSDSVGAMPASREDSLVAGLHVRFTLREQERLAEDFSHHAPPGQADAVPIRRGSAAVPHVADPRRRYRTFLHPPYAHRPLVEFMLTIPSNIVFGPNQPRRLMRRAFAGLVPPMVLNRKSKASYSRRTGGLSCRWHRLCSSDPRRYSLWNAAMWTIEV